jgi:amino acid adenylation domain-containing protein
VLIPQLLDRSAERFGHKAAFVCNDDELSYESLAARSNQLANALRADGVGRGDLVGVLMGKAIENAVAVYGIMRAGAAYVPLDPAAPLATLEAVATGCDLSHVVAEPATEAKATKLAARLAEHRRPAGERSPTVHLYGIDNADDPAIAATGWAEIDGLATEAPTVNLSSDDLAYIIFTSGSTGTPKGIMHTHGSGSAYAKMAAELYDVGPDDRLSNFPPLHFDQSTFDFFSGPMVGATTVIIPKQHQLVPASLSELIERERLTIWYSVPLALVQLLLYGVLEERDCSSLRWVVYGGEPFPVKHLKALMERWPQARFSNCYGPAETNQCTYHHLDSISDLPAVGADDKAASIGIPIGVACPGMETLIVDADDQPVEPGQSGELLVNSPTTMAGYWGRPEMNATVFHSPTGSNDPADRYYRTGDLVRSTADGLLEFLGRRDRQIKVRGFRVELDEVEAAVAAHPDVEEVAVTTARATDDTDALEIVAYVRAMPDAEATASGIQRAAASTLARHAIPSTITFVDDFPRTTSGKIDYPALQRERASV